MGKTKRQKGPRMLVDKPAKKTPLEVQILDDTSVRPPGRSKARTERGEPDDEFVDSRLSRRILDQAREQQEELEEEHGVRGKSKVPRPKTVSLGTASSHRDSESDSDDLPEGDEYYEDIHIDPADERALETFMSANPPASRTLADIIMEKITEKQTEIATELTDNASVQLQQVDPRVAEMYKNVRQILSKYRSGKLPKAFKVIPSLSNWEQILYLTEPESWSAAAIYQATRIFASNLNAKMAQRFFNLVLLPRIRDDIAEYKKLNFHLYQALKKALFKPAAFFKGIILPMCESGTCTLREAIIVASVLGKSTVPMLHSAAAILKIAEMDYNGANSIFLRTLLDKKYALPYRVVDAVVFHFFRFQHDKREMPVLWFQCFLTFVQRYKEDISSEQKELLFTVLRAHNHTQITPEIRRELVNSKCRGEENATEPAKMDI